MKDQNQLQLQSIIKWDLNCPNQQSMMSAAYLIKSMHNFFLTSIHHSQQMRNQQYIRANRWQWTSDHEKNSKIWRNKYRLLFIQTISNRPIARCSWLSHATDFHWSISANWQYVEISFIAIADPTEIIKHLLYIFKQSVLMDIWIVLEMVSMSAALLGLQ